MGAIEQLHQTIKEKLSTRTTEQLISDAKVSRFNKDKEEQRMIFALIMDVIAERTSEEEFEVLFDKLTA